MRKRGDPAEADYHEMIAVADAAISERDALRAALRHEADCVEAAKAEIAALRAKIERMGRQEPVGKFIQHPSHGMWEQDGYGDNPDAKPLYALPVAQPAPMVVAYLDLGAGGYMDIGTDLTDEALAALPKGRHLLGIVGTYGVEGYIPAQPAPSVPDVWLPVPKKHPTFDPVDLQLSDGSVLCGCVPQADGDYWWEGPSGEVFIDPKYANVTHWRLAADPLPEGE